MLKTTWMVLLAVAGSAAADPLPLWQVDGVRNSVFLLGSIHVLRDEDHPLPARMLEAYNEAEIVYMEIDMDDIDPVATLTLTKQLGVLEDGVSLSDLLGPEATAVATRDAGALNIPLDLLQRSEPWLAAMTVEQMLLMRQGFSAQMGVEMSVAALAQRDAKPVEGFETLEQQIGFLDGLSLDAQRNMLLQVLATNVDDTQLIDSMVNAWRHGDLDYFEAMLDEEREASPEIYEKIVVERNSRWVDAIDDMLYDDVDYLVVVGALHMIGEDGVPTQLRERGFPVNQIHDSTFEEKP